MTPEEHQEHQRRLEAVRAAMQRDGFDALVSGDTGDWLPPTGDARYLAGFSIGNMVNVVEGVAVLMPVQGSQSWWCRPAQAADSPPGRGRPHGPHKWPVRHGHCSRTSLMR